MKQYWLVKTEPETYGWDDLVREQTACWDGVRNYAARKHLNGMEVGDEVMVYHSVNGKAIVGIAKVVRAAYPDPTTDDDRWVAVDLSPVKKLEKEVTLEVIKQSGAFEDLGLVKQGRLSVMPVDKTHWDRILTMSKN